MKPYIYPPNPYFYSLTTILHSFLLFELADAISNEEIGAEAA